MKRWPLMVLAFVVSMSPISARAAPPVDEAEPAWPKLGASLLAGFAVPICSGDPASCAGTALGPSVQGRFMFAPWPRWAFGIVGELGRVSAMSSFFDMRNGAVHEETYAVTTGFVGLAAQFVLLPRLTLSPVASIAIGASYQSQPTVTISCSNGPLPTGELALGERVRLTRSVSLVGLASISGGGGLGCGISDATATPIVAWGFAFRAGATFDLPLGD
jgi:hypothetical protein